MTRTLSLAICLAWWSLGCENVLGHFLGHPAVRIEANQAATGYAFSFTNCRGGKPMVVRAVEIYHRGEGAAGLKALCSVRGRGSSDYIRTAWPYGTEPPGFKAAGICAPLEPGKEYDVHVEGPAMGVRSFAVKASGEIAPLEPACR